MSLYSTIMRNTFYPLVLRRDKMGSAYKYWDIYNKSQYWPRQKLLDYQFIKLKEMLTYSYENCVYYKEAFDDAGVTPESLKSFDDLSKFPILTRDILFKRNDDLISRKFSKSDLTQYFTGGTTGQQAMMRCDQESFNMKLAIEWRNESWMGKKPSDRIMYFWPNTIDFNEKETFKSAIKNRFIFGEKVVNSGYSSPEVNLKYYNEMMKFKPQYFKVFPASFLGFTEYIEKNNLPIPKIKGIMSTAEVLHEDLRNKFEEVFRCPVFDMYGSRETGNNASECSTHEGLHLSLETAVVEFVDDKLRNIEFGNEGEMLITDITNSAMPFIRYRINDFAVPLNQTCSCGRELPLIGSAMGRLQDFIYDPDGNRHNGNVFLIFNVLAKEDGILIGQLQYIQKSLTHFHVKVKNDPPPTKERFENITKWAKKMIDNRIEVTFEVVDEIPKEKSGKTRYVICEIDSPDNDQKPRTDNSSIRQQDSGEQS